MRINY